MASADHHCHLPSWRLSGRINVKPASEHCFIPAENLALHINKEKSSAAIPESILSCPLKLPAAEEMYNICFICFKAIIMALKSYMMKNYLWVCLFWACFTHSTWVTGAKFHLVTDVLFQNTEFLGKKKGPCKLKFTWKIFFGRVHRSTYKERKYLCFLLQTYQILKRELSPLVRSR